MSTKPTILLIELNKESFQDKMSSHMLKGLRSLGSVVQVTTPKDASSKITSLVPATILITTAEFAKKKHAVLHSKVVEYARAGIRVNALCPGPIDSPMGKRIAAQNPGYKDLLIAHAPNGRLGRPEEVAEAAVWLCSDAASLVNGLIMPVDGGSTAA